MLIPEGTKAGNSSSRLPVLVHHLCILYNVTMTYKAVLFDLDGTLLDTLQDIADATNVVLVQFGFPIYDLQTYRYFVGEGMAALAFKALPELYRDPDTLKQLLSGITKEYKERWAIHTKPYPGIPELLDALVTNRIKMAVLSNKPHEFIILQVEVQFVV